MKIFVVGLFVFVWCVAGSLIRAQEPRPSKISGRVIDADTYKPLNGVRVSAAGDQSTHPTGTDGNGTFSLELASTVKVGETVRIFFEKPEYDPWNELVTVSTELPKTYSLHRSKENHVNKPGGPRPKSDASERGLVPTQPPMFSESTDKYNITGGVTGHLTKENSSMCLVNWHGSACLLRGSVDNKQFVVDATLFVGAGHGSVEIIKNELHKNIPEWDRCFDATALEVVDENFVPVFQMTYTTPNDIVIYGIFHAEDTTVVAAPKGRLIIHPSSEAVTESEYPVKALFKYPSRRYHCKILADVQPIASQTTGPYRGLETKQFCAEVVREANKISEMADVSYARLLGSGKSGESPNTIRKAFSAEFIGCCLQTVEEMHEELIFRLKPAIESESEGLFRQLDWQKAHNSDGVNLIAVEGVSRYMQSLCGELPANIAVAPGGIANAAPNFGNQTVNNVPSSRVLSARRLVDFTATLGKARGMLRVILASSSDDVFLLAQQLCLAAANAQWGSACPQDRNSSMGRAVIAAGLECYSENWEAADSKAFKDAMNSAQLRCSYFPRAYDLGNGVEIGGSGGVTILIGSPPQN
jgi:hypothetical protein